MNGSQDEARYDRDGHTNPTLLPARICTAATGACSGPAGGCSHRLFGSKHGHAAVTPLRDLQVWRFEQLQGTIDCLHILCGLIFSTSWGWRWRLFDLVDLSALAFSLYESKPPPNHKGNDLKRWTHLARLVSSDAALH